MLLTVILAVLLLSLITGGIGYSRFGSVGMSPAGILFIVLFVLLLTGRRFGW